MDETNSSTSPAGAPAINIGDDVLLLMDPDRQALSDFIEKSKEKLSASHLTDDERVNTQLGLAQAYQECGEHPEAIRTLDSIEIDIQDETKRLLRTLINELKARSLSTAGAHREACQLFEDVLQSLTELNADPKFRAGALLEAGRAFKADKNLERARQCWEEALKYYEGKEDELNHYSRVRANLGFLLLEDPDEAIQEDGLKMISESSLIKYHTGDMQGVANNFCNLGLYYWKKKRYERAIAYLRKDLYYTRKRANGHELVVTLCNLSKLYIDARQLTEARKSLLEAKRVAQELRSEKQLVNVEWLLNKANEVGRLAGQNGEKLGGAAPCLCGSGKQYQNCCGRADFEPIEFPLKSFEVPPDLEPIRERMKAAGREPSRLDYILRESDNTHQRTSWTRMEFKEGWTALSELPDMANAHLTSARAAADESAQETDSINKPLACIILSACALEAFINQVAYFLHEIQQLVDSAPHHIPDELKGDPLQFQRHTELTQKWSILGRTLCEGDWVSGSAWEDFRNLIHIRNELVHFKAEEYEQITPPSKTPHKILRRVPATVALRDAPRSWPFRLLTPSFARWCVSTTELMIQEFKKSYNRRRIHGVK
jgi:tetratricopeptide (TPR) repeat protein